MKKVAKAKWTIGEKVPKNEQGEALTPLVKKKTNPVVRYIALAIFLPAALPAYAVGYLFGYLFRR